MDTIFNWLPNSLGMGMTQAEYISDCRRHGCPDQSRWGGYLDACEISGDVYGPIRAAMVVAGVTLHVIGGCIALAYAKSEILYNILARHTAADVNQPACAG